MRADGSQFNEIVKVLVLQATDRAALWTTTGPTACQFLIGLNVEVMFGRNCASASPARSACICWMNANAALIRITNHNRHRHRHPSKHRGRNQRQCERVSELPSRA
jgi:hypothetical protein